MDGRLGRLSEEVDVDAPSAFCYYEDSPSFLLPDDDPPANNLSSHLKPTDTNYLFYSADAASDWLRKDGGSINRLTFSTSEVEPYLRSMQGGRRDVLSPVSSQKQDNEDLLLKQMYDTICNGPFLGSTSLASAFQTSNSFLAEDEYFPPSDMLKTGGDGNCRRGEVSPAPPLLDRKSPSSIESTFMAAESSIDTTCPGGLSADCSMSKSSLLGGEMNGFGTPATSPPSSTQRITQFDSFPHERSLPPPPPEAETSTATKHVPLAMTSAVSPKKKSLNLMARELTHTLLGGSTSQHTETSTASSSPCSRRNAIEAETKTAGSVYDNFLAFSTTTTATAPAATAEPGATDSVVTEAIQALRAAVNADASWDIIYECLVTVIQTLGDRSPQRTLQIAMLAEMKTRQLGGLVGKTFAPLAYDKQTFCKGYAALWHVWSRLQNAESTSEGTASTTTTPPYGILPSSMGVNLSPGAQAVRSIVYGAQRLCLSAMATSSEMPYDDRKVCRQVALAGLSRLAWNDECLEALAGVFFEIEGQTERDEFAGYIAHWNATGVLQRIFEIFTITLARKGRWRALLWLLCSTRDLTHKLVDPALATKERFVSPVLPEAGILKACRPDILRGMRFPVATIMCLVHDLCDHLSETVEWPFITSPSHVVQSVLPLILGKTFCEETCVSHPWHADVFLNTEATLMDSDTVLQMIETGYLVEQDVDLLLSKSLGRIVLDEIISSFMFNGDPKLGPLYEDVKRQSCNPCYWLVGFESDELREQVKSVWALLGESTASRERFYALLELCSRLVESFWLTSHRTPAEELIELCEESVSVMNLEAARRAITELTGCRLGRIEIFLLKVLEAYDAAFGIPSDIPGLVGPPRTFNKVLHLTPFALQCLLSPIINYKLPASNCLCLNLKLAPSKEIEEDSTTTSSLKGVKGSGGANYSNNASSNNSISDDKEALIYPTLLPVHVARTLPAWFSTRGNIAALFGDDNRQYVGWRTVCLECLCASVVEMPFGKSKIAPHLSDQVLLSFLKLYIEAANPRALHLLTRWVSDNQCSVTRVSVLKQLLHLAEASKFTVLADAVTQLTNLSNVEEVSELTPAILSVYVAGGDGLSASLLLQQVSHLAVGRELEKDWRSKIDELISQGAQSRVEREAQLTAQGRSVRWHKAVQAVKGFSAVNSVESSIAFFKDLRKSPGGIPDISIANKIIHICVANNKLSDAEQLYRCLKQDAHRDAKHKNNGSHNVVKPDIVTCNILLKGLAKRKPPIIEEIEQFIVDMETPFHLGGDGVVADQVTFNTAINAAISAGSFEKAWEFLTTMKRRGIKVDGYTCSILMKQVGPSSRPEVVSEILRLLGEMDLVEDPVLLSSVVDVCSRLRDFSRLRMTLERYEAETPNPTPYAIATLVKGYGRCGMVHKASAWWDRLEQMPNVEWSQYIFGSAVDCFVTNGNLDKALAVFHKATRLNALLSDSQTTMLIRACTQRRRLQDALKLYRQMREHHLHLCDVTCNNLMHMCVTAGDLDTAMQILDDMSQNPMHQPDVVTYSTIIKGLCDCGAMKTAMQMFEELPSKGLKPDIVTYNTLLEGFAKSEDLAQVENLFNQLIANNVKPTCYTLTILVKFYGRRHKLDKALDLVESLPKLYGIRMDAFVYTATIAACTWNGRVDKAIGFLQAMRQSFGASARTYGTLVAGCVKQQAWDSLSAVLDYATEDRISLGKRDASSLQELSQSWNSCTMAQKWIMSGFNEEAAIRVQKFLATQQQTRQNGNSMRRL